MKIGVVIMTTEIMALNPEVAQAWRSSIDEIMSTIGIEFFHSLVKHLARALGAYCVYIAELTPAPRSRFRTWGYIWTANTHKTSSSIVRELQPAR
jgi:hypothetical protein